ncbi:prepilin peptidase [Candidatus Saccharibacteria bacterium]|nr:prepilin peptidase [Candidatus Saccharibacteria bacterium]
MTIVYYVILFVLGACFGSFLCCQARRQHHNTHSAKRLSSKRSVCLHCHYQLKWYDNIPILSWLALRGKCRKCHKPIGLAEILAELTTGLAFLALGTTFDPTTTSILSWVTFITTLVFILVVGFLAIYDGLYGELPTRYLVIAIFIGTIILILHTILHLQSNPFTPELIWRPLASVAILGGLYLALYLVSRGKWVGDGDWLLATTLALVLADPWPAFIALFLANLIACFIMLPLITKSKTHKIYFGPFLVIAFVIALMI